MSSQGNGQLEEYHVSYSGKFKKRIKALHAQAASKGKGQQILDAVRTVLERLRKDPKGFGDPLYRLPALKLMVYQAVAPPILVHYGVHDEKRLVFLRGVFLFG